MSDAPTGGYLICASPRSGSTLLCDLLTATGALGAPDSFFRPASVPEFAADRDVPVDAGSWGRAYVEAALHHGSAPTGRFGMRIMWRDVPGFLARLAALHPVHPDAISLLRSVLGIERFVHLSRLDKVAEAVSLVIAEQTGLWHRHADGTERERLGPPAPPVYDRDRIGAHVRMLEAEAVGWATWFRRHAVEPIAVTYEELAADPERTRRTILEHLGVELDAGRDGDPEMAARPRTARLATDLNVDWATRFRSGR